MDTQPPEPRFLPLSHDTVQGTQEGTPRKVPGHSYALAGMGGNVAEPRGAEEPLASPAGGLEVSAPLGRELVQTGAGAGASYQAHVQSVVVVLRHRQVHGQRHAVGEDGEEDDRLEGSGTVVKESPLVKCGFAG